MVVSDAKWDGKISNLNISEQAFPELYRELSRMQHKARSDRLRSLALLGLYSLHSLGRQNPEQNFMFSQPVSTQAEKTKSDVQLNSRRDSLKGKLMGAVRGST